MRMTIEEATEFFAKFYRGEHHFPGKLRPFGEGWCINHCGDLSTYDFNMLTRLVFLAHDYSYRASIMQGSPRGVKIAIWKRVRRQTMDEKMSFREYSEIHPTIDEALKVWRENHQEIV